MTRLDLEILSKAIEQVEWVYSDAFPALRTFRWELERKLFLDSLSSKVLEALKTRKIDIDRSLFKNYRDYYNHPEKESWESLVLLSSYWVPSQDVYYWYSQIHFDRLIKLQKIDWFVCKTWENTGNIKLDTFNLSKDIFQNFSPEKQRGIIQNEFWKLGYSIIDTLDSESLELVRRAVSIYAGNLALGQIFEKNGDIRVRETIAQALKEINLKLKPLGYSIAAETGHRSMSEQRVIKENHARTFWSADANRLYADEWKSDHHTWGAIDVILLGLDGKKINLALGDNSPKTKTLLYGEELLWSWNDLLAWELQAIQWRRLLYHIMTWAWFQPLISEYWHYWWWGRLSRYLESQSKGKMIPSQYENK